MGKLKVVKDKSRPSQDYKSKKQKPKRWKKGHSCASNPETTKFRQAAKERLFSVNTGMWVFPVMQTLENCKFLQCINWE